jgi:ubiquinone/menaquinone biosynthesis C-methylase UbiE
MAMSYNVVDVIESNLKTVDMYDHFSNIASRYHLLRTTDLEPVAFMMNRLNDLPFIKASDIGCGSGRYDQILCREFGNRIDLTCVDANASMLEALNRNMTDDGIEKYTLIQSSAEDLPLPDNSYDCIFTFNAIHHFDLFRFIDQCSRILKNDGYLFIYTRLREQNKRNVWGMYFPAFHQKETRLYTMDVIMKTITSISNMWLQSVEFFRYNRLASLWELEKKVRSHHYSTFFLYSMDELENAICRFKKKMSRVYGDVHRIQWFDENVLFVVRKVNGSILN